MAKTTGRPVREELLTAASSLIQRVGVSEFSYGALAEVVGIRSPSIHHHFPRKDDLVAAVAHRYRVDFNRRVAALTDGSSVEQMHGYAALFASTAADGLLCLCGAVAADWLVVGAEAQAEVDRFFENQISWLTARFADGITQGEFQPDLDPTAAAKALFAMLEGSVLVTRAAGDADPAVVTEFLLTALAVQQGPKG